MLLLYRVLLTHLNTIHLSLHSIMLLLYRVWCYWYYRLYSFTFHYASTLSGGSDSDILIHLHLHSIMLLLYRIGKLLQKGEWAQFTFHYASTLSAFLLRIPYQVLHLHSIMLLLYLICPTAYYRSCTIYIPLCFYFIE